MGGCVSTSSQSSSSSRSNGETVSPSCFGILCGRRKRFSDHINMLKHLSSIPNRIFTNGKSRSSCIFTQQGRKGINQDAMIVWEVSFSPSVIYKFSFVGLYLYALNHCRILSMKIQLFVESSMAMVHMDTLLLAK